MVQDQKRKPNNSICDSTLQLLEEVENLLDEEKSDEEKSLNETDTDLEKDLDEEDVPLVLENDD
jgi:hypothetical protein